MKKNLRFFVRKSIKKRRTEKHIRKVKGGKDKVTAVTYYPCPLKGCDWNCVIFGEPDPHENLKFRLKAHIKRVHHIVL